MAKWNGKKVAKKVAEALDLEDDFLLREIEDAESQEEAVDRMESIQQDIETALEILEEEGGEPRGNPGEGYPRLKGGQVNSIKCKCGKKINLSSGYDVVCDSCGQPYNSLGQRLRRGHHAECHCNECEG